MAMVVGIKIEAPQALPTIAAVEAGLGKVETAGARATDALAKGFGNSSSAAEKAKQSTESLTEQMARLAGASSAFKGFDEVFKREADMLERIKGPAREYASDLRALDMLLQKDAISTKEYADQVTNLNRQMGERPTPAVAVPPTVSHSGGEEGGIGIEGSVSSAVAGQFGELGSSLEGLASKGAIEATAMAALVAEAVNLGDEYVELSNKAMKLVDSTHSVDDVLGEQFELSKQLHGSLEQTMELTTIVKERTEDLGLSTQQTNAFTKELAAGVELSGHSMGDAAGVVDRLSFALENGLPAGRQMKSLMSEYPAVAKDLESSLGMTAKQIIDMAQKGQLSLQTFVGGISGTTKAFDTLQGRAETLGTQWQHFKDGLVITAGKLVEQTGLLTAIGAVFKVLGDVVEILTTVLGGIHDALGNVGTAAVAMGAAFALGLGPLMGIVVAVEAVVSISGSLVDWINKETEARIKARDVQISELEIINQLLKVENEDLDAAINSYEAHNDLANSIERVTTARAAGQKILDDSSTASVAAREHVDALKVAFDGIMQQQAELKSRGAFQFGADPKSFLTSSDQKVITDYAKAQQDLNDSQKRYGSTLQLIHEQERARAEGIKDLNDALKAHDITQAEYDKQMQQYAGHTTDATKAMKDFNTALAARVKIYDENAAAAQRYAVAAQHGDASAAAAGVAGTYGKKGDDLSGATAPKYAAENRQALSDFGTESAIEKSSQDKQSDMEKRYQAVIDATASSADKYQAELDKINSVSGELGPEKTALAVQNLNEKFGATVSPAEKFNKQIADLKELAHDGAISGSDLAKQLEVIGKEQEKLADSGKDMASGLSRGWHEIRDGAQDSASTIASSMKGAFDEVNSDIVSMVTTGTADWGKLASTIEADFAKIALQKVEGSIFGAFSSKVTDTSSAAAVGTTTGTSASTTMLGSAPGIGIAIGNAAAGVMAAGSAASGAASGITQVVGSTFGGASGDGSYDDFINGSWAGSETMIHAANGYRGRVGGVGGIDTKLFASMVSPGEHVSIQTPEQHAASQSGGGGKQNIQIVNQHDTRGELASGLSSGAFDSHIVNVLKRNKDAVQSLIRK